MTDSSQIYLIKWKSDNCKYNNTTVNNLDLTLVFDRMYSDQGRGSEELSAASGKPLILYVMSL